MRERNATLTKKLIADECAAIYKDKTLSTQKITNRLNALIRKELANVGIVKERKKIGDKTVTVYRLDENINEKAIHVISQRLGEWRNAIHAVNMKHHMLYKNAPRLIKKLKDHIPGIDRLLDPALSLAKLRKNLTILIKNTEDKPIKYELKKLHIEHHAYYLLQSVYEWSREQATSQDRTNRDKRLNSQIKVNPDFVVNAAIDVMEQALDQSEEKTHQVSLYELAVAIGIATGRRRTEIFKTAHFSIKKDTPEQHVEFKGQLKTKDRALFEKLDSYPIPCLVKPQMVVDCLALLRDMTADDEVTYRNKRGNEVTASPTSKGINDVYHTEAVGEFYNHSSQAATRRILKNPRLTFRNLRDMYSMIGYPLFKNEGEAPSAFRTRIYGHSDGISETQLHYEKFEITDKVDGIEFLEDSKKSKTTYTKLAEALGEYDDVIEKAKRSPTAAVIHAWLKEQLINGLAPKKITLSYTRQYASGTGKSININTVKKYYAMVEWDKLVEEHGEAERVKSTKPEVKLKNKPEEDTIKKPASKPRFSHWPKEIADGVWSVTFEIDEDEFTYEVEAPTKEKAAKIAIDKHFSF